MRSVCVVLVDRANYGRLKPVMHAIDAHPELRLQVVAAGTMVLERFDRPVDVLREDGFEIDSEVFLELEGSTPTTMAKSVGFGTVEFAGEFRRLAPDVVLVIGDRYEALAAAVAAAYMNLCLVHIQGGEVSGSIDESARHAITRFAHFHVPSTRRSRDYLVRMGERPETILTVGCPSSDIARGVEPLGRRSVLNERGSGAAIDPNQPFLLVVFHPTTTEHGAETGQMQTLLAALDKVRKPTLLLWPNIDAGSDHISKAIRVHRDRQPDDQEWLRTLINLPPEAYLQVLAAAACAVGNSSSFVRDASFLGTPVVLVGNRQRGREMDVHGVRVPVEEDAIVRAISARLAAGRHAPSTLYGDGHVSERIADALATLTPYCQKTLHYVDEAEDGAGR
jgi:UDP-hydrolysing UDP-N-acetyl-D-glucosamine 2-epimerase